MKNSNFCKYLVKNKVKIFQKLQVPSQGNLVDNQHPKNFVVFVLYYFLSSINYLKNCGKILKNMTFQLYRPDKISYWKPKVILMIGVIPSDRNLNVKHMSSIKQKTRYGKANILLASLRIQNEKIYILSFGYFILYCFMSKLMLDKKIGFEIYFLFNEIPLGGCYTIVNIIEI